MSNISMSCVTNACPLVQQPRKSIFLIREKNGFKAKEKSWFGGNAPKRVNKNKPVVTTIKNITLMVFSQCALKVEDFDQFSVFLVAEMLARATNKHLAVRGNRCS